MGKFIAGIVAVIVVLVGWHTIQSARQVSYERQQLWKLAAALSANPTPPQSFSDAEIALIRDRVARGDQAFAFLAQILAKDAQGNATLTTGDALMQLIKQAMAQPEIKAP